MPKYTNLSRICYFLVLMVRDRWSIWPIGVLPSGMGGKDRDELSRNVVGLCSTLGTARFDIWISLTNCVLLWILISMPVYGYVY